MNIYTVGSVLVHKSLGGQPLVVIDEKQGEITVRFGTQGQYGIQFVDAVFLPEELETPVESIEREGEIFRALNEKKRDIETPQGKLIPIN